MILGTGIDIVALDEFDTLCRDNASAFLQTHFTVAEQVTSERKPGGALSHLAARYAAKEAFIKALDGTHLFRPKRIASIDYRDIEVAQDPGGRPYLLFHGPFAALAKEFTACHLSLSHDGNFAIAQVIIE